MAGISRAERERRAALAAQSAPGGNAPAGAAPTAEPKQPNPKPAPSTQEPPVFSVAERRLKHGDLAMLSERANIKLVNVDQPMALYWGMTEDAYDIINVCGWVPVHVRYLPMKANMMGLSEAPDGNVTRGKNGSEMLFMMPEDMREAHLFNQANARQVRRLSRRHHLQQAISSAQADAQNAALSPARRESAARSAAMMESNQKAKFTFTEYTESHSRNSNVE